jgi:uncharacterized protein (TIGR00730 family)
MNHIPYHKYRPKRLTPDEIREGCITLNNGDQTEARICVINEEFRQGFDFIKTYEKSVSFFGSARTQPGDEHYEQARRLGYRVAKELGYAVVTGGGPGIMQAGNQGAHEAGGRSIGFTIALPFEQTSNPYMTDELPFYFFFSRKVALAYSAEAYCYFPGGFGTLDELFEILTLIQTEKISKVPVILVGVDYWQPLDDFIKKTLLEEHHTISPEDLNLYTITDNEDAIIELIKNAPVKRDD